MQSRDYLTSLSSSVLFKQFCSALLISLAATSVVYARGPDSCMDLGRCGGGSGGTISAIGAIIFYGALFYVLVLGGIKESYQKRGAKGPVVILLMIMFTYLSIRFSQDYGWVPFVICFTSVWWLSPLMDRLFPHDPEDSKPNSQP